MERLQKLVAEMRRSAPVLDLLNDGIALYRRDGTVAYANVAARRIIGWQLGIDEPLAHFSGHLPAEKLEEVEAQFTAVLDFGRNAEFETSFRHTDGSSVDVTVRLMRAEVEGETVGVIGVAVDISTQKTVEEALLRSQQQFRSLFEHHPEAITMLKADGRYSRVNRAAEALTGYLSEDIIGKTDAAIVVPERIETMHVVRSAVSRGESVSFETTIARKDGKRVEVEGTAIPILVDGKPDGFFSVTHDVTETRRAAAALDLQARRINALYQVAATAGVSPKQQIERALRLGLLHLGYDWAYVAQIDNDQLTIVHSVGDGLDAGYSSSAANSMTQRTIAAGEMLFVDEVGHAPWAAEDDPRPKWGSYLAIPITVDGLQYGAVSFVNRTIVDRPDETDRDFVLAISSLIAASVDRHLQESRLDSLAFYDALTGLPNRVLFGDRVEQALVLSRRHRRHFAVHFIDFDHFKEVNDAHGHAIGDELLVVVAKRLATGLRASDTLARFGGDEFIVLQPEISAPENALETAHRLLDLVREPFVVRGLRFNITVSIGVSIYPDDGDDAGTLVRKADAALYRVKERGRNGVLLHDSLLAGT